MNPKRVRSGRPLLRAGSTARLGKSSGVSVLAMVRRTTPSIGAPLPMARVTRCGGTWHVRPRGNDCVRLATIPSDGAPGLRRHRRPKNPDPSRRGRPCRRPCTARPAGPPAGESRRHALGDKGARRADMAGTEAMWMNGRGSTRSAPVTREAGGEAIEGINSQ